MNDRIVDALTKLFVRHRIVFWYDAQRELREDYESVQLDGVTKKEVSGDAFGVKHLILREQPEKKFLLYFHGPQPEDLDNWLLDVQLSQGEFRASATSIITSELNLPPELETTVEAHIVFFDAKSRVEALARLLTGDETSEGLVRKMLAVCVGTKESALEAILESLLAELAAGGEEKVRLIGRCALDEPLWKIVQARYGYESASPSIHDFALSLFKSGYMQGVQHFGTLSDETQVFLRRWKDSIQHQPAFEALSNSCAHELGIEQDLEQRNVRDLLGVDLFKMIDQRILSQLAQYVAAHRIDLKECLRIIHERRSRHWFTEFKHLYGAVETAAQLLYGIDAADLRIESLEDGFTKYASAWFRFDQLYRKFIFHCRKAGRITLVQELAEQVENIYTSRFVLDVNNRWQQMVDRSSPWEVRGIPAQREFYRRWVKPFPTQDKKVFVIISDALRYEVADDLLSRIRQEDRYEAKLEAMLGSLPSTTQIGMAALLPHNQVTVSTAANAEVLVDDINPTGTAARAKILDYALPGQATAIQAEEFLQMDRDEARDLTRLHQVVYIYHNQIDAVGDKRDSEKRVFEAVDETLETLILMIKKLAAANANNILVTADHGFLYQDRALDESDFTETVKDSGDATYRGRRFIVGKSLPEHSSLRKFQASELGLSGDLEIQIPKSINRLRLQGSGSRFVHGGASLQEIVLPVLSINKKRKSDVREVNVDILAGESSVITSGQLSVKFYQTEPVTEKVQPRKLRAGIFTAGGVLISDQHELVFDHASDSAREREKVVRFILTGEADSANNQPVELRLEENVQGTTHYRVYRRATYQLRRSFTTDFDI
jgi:uncharacterized protein (TIGR02687 family)